MSILNESAYILQPSAQQAIKNACANSGTESDTVVAEFAYTNDDNPIFDIKEENGNYLFSIDTATDKIFDKTV